MERFCCSRVASKEADGEGTFCELEVSLVVKLEQGRAVRMVLLEMKVMDLGLVARVAALLAHVHFSPTLLVRVFVLNAMDLQGVRFQGATLREGLVTQDTFVGAHACMCPGMPLEIEGVIEALATEGAQVAFDVAVALHVSVQKPLQSERFSAHLAGQPTGIGLGVVIGSLPRWRKRISRRCAVVTTGIML